MRIKGAKIKFYTYGVRRWKSTDAYKKAQNLDFIRMMQEMGIYGYV